MRFAALMVTVFLAVSVEAAERTLANGGFERLLKWTVFERRAQAPATADLPKEVTRKTSPRVRLEAAFGSPIRVRGRIVKETPGAYHILMFDEMPATLKKEQTEVVGAQELPAAWRFHDVVRPARIDVTKADAHGGSHAIVLSAEGGRGFLHSSLFPVKAGRTYEAAIWAKGSGRVGLQLVWWKRYDRIAIERAEPHLAPAPLKGKLGLIAEMQAVERDWQYLRSGPLVAPANATCCYLRIQTIKGRVLLDDAEVIAVPPQPKRGE